MSTAIPLAINPGGATPLWATLADELDIAPSLYQKAADRHTSVGEWLCRPGSSLRLFDPSVHPQGSFRYGTVIKPLVEEASYDLDQVVVLKTLRSHDLSQADLKARLGAELAAYADFHGMLRPEEKHRCWRLNYRDDVAFHLDSVPSVPAAPGLVLGLRLSGVDEAWASRAVAITDDRHPQYHLVGGEWLTSNPRGFARWFEAQAARGRTRMVANGARASVEDVPAYEWRTPLQRAIQILKRHRDVMFRRTPDLAPISMIITNLAARAYEGEQDVGNALTGIVARMGQYVRPLAPRVPNPTHPAEDYADKWRRRPELELNFWRWLEQVRADVRHFSEASLDAALVEQRFAVQLTEEQQRRLAPGATRHVPGAVAAPAIISPRVVPRIETAPRPWQSSLSRGGPAS
jgi:hypothetical protein